MTDDEYDQLLVEIDELRAQVQQLQEQGVAPSAAGSAPVVRPLIYEGVIEWVDAVFVSLARRRKGTWCPRWMQHPEALDRLTAMWRSWETIQADTPGQTEEWMRLVFDHHTPRLLAGDGPFSHCTPERHGDPPPPLAPTDRTVLVDITEAANRLFAPEEELR